MFHTTGSYTPTNPTDVILTVPPAKPAGNYELAVKAGANTLISTYNTSQHGYAVGPPDTVLGAGSLDLAAVPS